MGNILKIKELYDTKLKLNISDGTQNYETILRNVFLLKNHILIGERRGWKGSNV